MKLLAVEEGPLFIVPLAPRSGTFGDAIARSMWYISVSDGVRSEDEHNAKGILSMKRSVSGN